MSGERSIRAYCPTHKTSTMAATPPVIICESGEHALSQNFPYAEFWEYCCDCQSFRPSEIAASGKAQERCMVCDRQVARRFLCAHCQVISIESDEAAKRRKPYVVNAAGAVEPACPGCLRAAGPPIHAHACGEVDAGVSTAREVCPFCDQPVRPKPAPEPAPVSAFTTPLTPLAGGGAAETRHCSNCGAPAPHEFCNQCGASQSPGDEWRDPDTDRLDEPPPAAIPDTAPVGQTPPPANGSSRKGAFIVLAVVIALVAVVAVAASISKWRTNSVSNSNGYSYNATSTESAKTKLERAISQGNLVQPLGTSARDYYDQFVREGASSAEQNSLRDRLLPMLKEKPMRLLADLYEPGSPDSPLYEWEEATKLLAWASQLSPNDSTLEARAVYCEGRVAYHNRNMNEARRLWQRAGELDPSWALPVNGVGLTYVDSTSSDKQKWVEARPYYNEAIRRDSSWAVPYNNLGTSYLKMKDSETARSYYQRAVSLAPRWARPHAWLGDIAMADKDCTTAVEEYKTALDLDSTGRPGWDVTKLRQSYKNAVAGSGCY
jgi:tetratricopeptide (TPR) repeat protein